MNTVTISLMEYAALVRASESIEAVERLVNSGEYVTTETILAVLGVEREGTKC